MTTYNIKLTLESDVIDFENTVEELMMELIKVAKEEKHLFEDEELKLVEVERWDP